MSAVSIARRLIRSVLSERTLTRLRRARLSPRLGSVDFGDFLRIRPISSGFGFKRGTPIDRFYIERFLDRHRSDIRGRVLEAGDSIYSQEFGSEIARQDILNLLPGSSGTTIAGDLGEEDLLEASVYDCLVLTQFLQFVFDMRSAVRRMHDSLAPGGVVLATVPGITPIDPAPDGSQWYWSFNEASLRRLFEDVFGSKNVEIATHGNVLAATSFLQGIALEELGEQWLEVDDPVYPVIITVRAQRAA